MPLDFWKGESISWYTTTPPDFVYHVNTCTGITFELLSYYRNKFLKVLLKFLKVGVKLYLENTLKQIKERLAKLAEET